MFLILLLLWSVGVYSSEIVVKGYLNCPRQYGCSARVFLMERDFSNTPFDELDPDDTMAFADVDLNKKFTISGEEEEVSALEPYLYVIFNCDGTPREASFDLPKAPFKKNVYKIEIDLTDASFTVFGPKQSEKQ